MSKQLTDIKKPFLELNTSEREALISKIRFNRFVVKDSRAKTSKKKTSKKKSAKSVTNTKKILNNLSAAELRELLKEVKDD